MGYVAKKIISFYANTKDVGRKLIHKMEGEILTAEEYALFIEHLTERKVNEWIEEVKEGPKKGKTLKDELPDNFLGFQELVKKYSISSQNLSQLLKEEGIEQTQGKFDSLLLEKALKGSKNGETPKDGLPDNSKEQV